MKLRINIIVGYITAVCLGISLLTSCKPKAEKEGEASGDLTVISFEQVPGNFRLTDSFKDISCIQLEMTDESVLGHIKKIIEAEGLLVVLTKDNEVTVFNREDGKFIRVLGSTGEGPEEFLEAQDMFYDPEEGLITVYDRMKGDFVSYRLNGEFAGKRKADGVSPWMESLERADDGTMLVCNSLTGGNPPSDYAFTLIVADRNPEGLDPFSPVEVKDFTTPFAERSMSACGNEIKFVKFMSDTIFSVKRDEVHPLFKLKLGNGMVPKKVAADLNYGSEMIRYSIDNRRLLGIDKVFETSGLIALIPTFETLFGYYWIDKASGKGYHVESANSIVFEVMPEMNKVVGGRTIMNIVGSNPSGMISCVEDVESLTQALTEHPEESAFPENVNSKIMEVDPDGNPVIIIYSH